jgi:cholesterol transport system auxiliary component
MMRRAFALLLAAGFAAALASCAAVPDKPVRATVYDFGPGPTAPAAAAAAPLRPIVLADVAGSSALDNSAVQYRLAYSDAHQLQPYAHARWSASPPQLIRQRLREQLGQARPVLDPAESAALARTAGGMPRVLRVEIEEFSQLFDSAARSWGLLRLRVTLLENTPGGEKLLGQRDIVKREPAPTADAPGGVRALAAATDAAAAEIGQWLQQTPDAH